METIACSQQPCVLLCGGVKFEPWDVGLMRPRHSRPLRRAAICVAASPFGVACRAEVPFADRLFRWGIFSRVGSTWARRTGMDLLLWLGSGAAAPFAMTHVPQTVSSASAATAPQMVWLYCAYSPNVHPYQAINRLRHVPTTCPGCWLSCAFWSV